MNLSQKLIGKKYPVSTPDDTIIFYKPILKVRDIENTAGVVIWLNEDTDDNSVILVSYTEASRLIQGEENG